LHDWALEAFGGGGHGILDERIIDSAVAQPQMTFDGQELYPTLADKAVALAFPIIHSHPFVDGNKRTGFLAANVFTSLNGCQFICEPRRAEEIILEVAAGDRDRPDFVAWVSSCIVVPPTFA
jgi:death-on-curing protein